MEFKPEDVDPDQATYFYNGVSGHFTRNNVSLRPQQGRADQGLPRADVLLPLQNIETYRQRIYYLDSEEIIETTCTAVSGRVYVKMHPLHSAAEQDKYRRFCAQFPNAEIVDASVHDLIAASDIIVKTSA